MNVCSSRNRLCGERNSNSNMQSRRTGKVTTPLVSGLTIDTVSCCLEDLLESDDLFVDYFNAFLCLPTFPEPLFYNKRTGGLELCADEQKQQVAARIRSAFYAYKATSGQSRCATKAEGCATKSGVSRNGEAIKSQDTITTEFTVKTLDREQGIQWLKERRTPVFLNSDSYFEYRLAKMLSQTDINLVRQKKVDLVEIATNDSVLDDIRLSNCRLEMMIEANDEQPDHSEEILKKLYVSLGETPASDRSAFVSQAKMNLDTKTSGSLKARPQSCTAQHQPVSYNSYIARRPTTSQVVANHGVEVTASESTTMTKNFCNKSRHQPQFLQVEEEHMLTIFPTSNSSSKNTLMADDENHSRSSLAQVKEAGNDLNLEKLAYDSDDDGDDISYFDDEKTELSRERKKKLRLKRRSGILEFQKFLRGTSGEKVWNLWMDIERGKKIADKDELKRHLARMKEQYIIVGAMFELTPESKSQLSLLLPSNWNMDHLAKIQNRIALPLLCYWGPRYLLQLENRLSLEAVDLYKEYMKLKALPEADPYPVVLPTLPHRPRSCHSLKMTSASTPPHINNMMEGNKASGTKGSEESNQRIKLNSILLKRPQTVPHNKAFHRQWSDSNQNKHLSKDHPFGEEKSLNLQESLPQFNKLEEEKEQRVGFGKLSLLVRTKLERLLQALACEQRAGKFLRKHIEKVHNQLWRNCLNFWESCHEYHSMFYEEPFKPDLLAKKAKFVGPGAEMSIFCSKHDADDIHRKLDPPFEELFDKVEEYVLGVLYSAWESAMEADLLAYNKILKREEKRILGEKSAVVVSLQRKGIVQIRKLPRFNDANLDSELYHQTIECLPPDLRDFTLQRILSNRMELENFREFLSDNYASLDLHCWMDIENYRRIPEYREVLRSSKADDIKETYLNRQYFFGPNSPASKEEQAKVIACGNGFGRASNIRPTDECLYEVQKYVQHRLEFKWVHRFLTSKAFGRHRQSQVSISHVIDDAIAQQKRKTQVVSRATCSVVSLTCFMGFEANTNCSLNCLSSHSTYLVQRICTSKWIPTTEKITQLRQALLNPLTSTQFMKFVSVRGNRLENNILFWQEVQKFKDICHSSSDKTLMRQKASVIIACFLRSTIPPTIQITVGPELAEQIVRANEEQTSPYVFKDAQKRVFLSLLPHWDDFCSYRDKLAFNAAEDDPLAPLVNERKNEVKHMRRQKQKQLDEKRDKENARRRALLAAEHHKRVERKWSMAWSDDDDLDSEFEFFRDKPISWSYSKYLAAFKKEQVLTRMDLPELCGMVEALQLTELPQVTNSAEDGEDGETGSLGDDHVSILSLKNADLGNSGQQSSAAVF